MFYINKKYAHVEKLIHNLNGKVINLHGVDLEIPNPVSPLDPSGRSRVIPGATQEELKEIFNAPGNQDVILTDEIIDGIVFSNTKDDSISAKIESPEEEKPKARNVNRKR